MATIQFDFKISWDDFQDICSTASFGGIDGWAHESHLNKEDGIFTIVDEELVHHHVSKEKVEQVIADLFSRRKTCPEATWKSIEWAVIYHEYGEIDAADADIIFQLACFDEIVYG
jgi:hypothetical protein